MLRIVGDEFVAWIVRDVTGGGEWLPDIMLSGEISFAALKTSSRAARSKAAPLPPPSGSATTRNSRLVPSLWANMTNGFVFKSAFVTWMNTDKADALMIATSMTLTIAISLLKRIRRLP